MGYASKASGRHGRAASVALVAVLLATLLPASPVIRDVAGATLPTGFTEAVAWSGLTNPTVLQFASDGRVFVAEKSGLIKYFDGPTDTSASVFADLRTNTYNFWDRGMLGMVLDPGFPTTPYVYVLYTYDKAPGSSQVPRWGTAGATSDPCPNPPGATSDGCMVTARLSRLRATGNVWDGVENVLVEDWCQQFPSHSIGTLVFGPEGALYASGGDGASFNTTDYGQLGGSLAGTPTPANPCGDPPFATGTRLSSPSAEGGALRSQDLRTIASGGGPSYSATVLAHSPVAYWRLGETSGSTAVDLVAARNGNYLGGTILGVPGGVISDGDTAVRFDGLDDRVSVPDNDIFSLTRTGQLSVEFWARPATDAGTHVIISKGTANNYEWAIDRDGWGYHAIVYNAQGGIARIGQWTPGNWAKDTWQHVVVTLQDNVAMRIYVDGVEVASGTTWTSSSTNGTSPLEIGRRADAQFPYAGDVDEVAIYDRVLSPSEVAEHHTAGTSSGGGGPADPVSLDGTVIRIDPATGLAWPGNPNTGPDENARRVIAYGMRNPFRMTIRPGTSEIWVGDVGYTTWEEINRIVGPGAPVENLGWPCYEGVGRQPAYDATNLTICENLYSAGTGAVLSPHFTYNHASKVVSTDTCATGSSAVAGLQFYPASGGPYPAAYQRALFFADNSRDCIWVMKAGTSGLPDPAQIEMFVGAAANPVDIKLGPDGRIYYVDFDGGTIRRIDFAGATNQPPTAVANAVPTTGNAPLTVQFNSTGSTDPENGALTYAWDLDADGAFDDGTAATASWTYTTSGTVNAVLRVTDPVGASDTDVVTITVGGASNQPPTAVAQATPTSGQAPLTVNFNGSSSSDPENGVLTYAWDLDDDGVFDDSTSATPSWTYTTAGTKTPDLRVTDPLGATDTDTVTITVSPANQPPVPVISAPATNDPWTVGQLISFAGSATDPEQGSLPATALSWQLLLQHCPSNCHSHVVQTWDDVASGSFNAPDHEYPSYLDLVLTATDAQGASASVTKRLDPATVVLTFQSAPTGLQLTFDSGTAASSFQRTVIVGSAHTISADSPQTLNGLTYTFSGWSDGGAIVHGITAPATNATYTATFTTSSRAFTPVADAEVRTNKPTSNFGTLTSLRVRTGGNAMRSYLRFNVTGLSGTPTNTKLRLFITDGALAARSLYLISNTTWSETGITWNNSPALPATAYRTFQGTTAGVWVEIDLGTMVTGNGLYSIAVANGSTDVVGFDSREGTNDPQLIVTGG